jgi:hypothetical protein
MTPVKQSIIYNDQTIGNGDCLTACYASLLDLPLWAVPPFHQMYGRPDYEVRVKWWLKNVMKLEHVAIYGVGDPDVMFESEKEALLTLPEFYIACGPTVRGGGHACIYSKGEMIHDPHASDAGLLKVDKIYYVKSLP